MSYLFDDASSHSLRRSLLSAVSMSVWFYPDDSALDCVVYAEYNAARSRYMKLIIRGSTTDVIELETYNSVTLGSVTSTGTVNYNAWNHVYAARGIVSSTRAYISLNGETLVDGGAGSYVAPGSMASSALGRLGTTVPIEYFSGKIAEAAFWNDCLNDWDNGYTALSLGFDPRLISVETQYGVQLQSYSPLIALPHDLMTGTSWTVASPTVQGTGTADSHPRIHRNFLE